MVAGAAMWLVMLRIRETEVWYDWDEFEEEEVKRDDFAFAAAAEEWCEAGCESGMLIRNKIIWQERTRSGDSSVRKGNLTTRASHPTVWYSLGTIRYYIVITLGTHRGAVSAQNT